MYRRFLAVLGTATAAAAGCATANKSIASLDYDLGQGRRTLYSYAPEPTAQRRGVDARAKGAYAVDTRLPRTPYLCVWRDPNVTDRGVAAPKEVFLACIFGASDWTAPPSLLQQFAERARRDEGVVRMAWTWTGRSYRLHRLEVDIRDVASKTQFRSINFEKEVERLAVSERGLRFPKRQNDTFTFRISASLPHRFNTRDAAAGPLVPLTLSGTAVPTPKWLPY